MNKSMWFPLLLAGSLLGASAHAQLPDTSVESRDTGVGRVIAEQGNVALATLRDQIKRDITLRLQAQFEQLLEQQATQVRASGERTVALHRSNDH